MEGLIGSVMILGIVAYFFSKDSKSPAKGKSTFKSNPQTPISNYYSNSAPPNTKASGYPNSTHSQKSSYSTTGEFSRSNEGYIPTDKCECGGQWVKHVNKTTGGRFFGCSRFPGCDNTRDKQQSKNFCSNGHPRTNQNTHYNSDGSRRCLICRPLPKEPSVKNFRESNSERSSSRSSSNDTNLYCRNGHKRSVENTYFRPNGDRECGTCRKNARK